MKAILIDQEVCTMPDGIRVPVKVEWHYYEDGMQFIIMNVDNPIGEFHHRGFNAADTTRWDFSCRHRDDYRMNTGGNTILHDYTPEEAQLYAEMMVEQFRENVYYHKTRY